MEEFRKRFKDVVLKYFSINVILSTVILLVTYPFVSKDAGTEAYGFTMMGFVFNFIGLLFYWIISLATIIIIPNSLMKMNFYIIFSYLFFPLVFLVIISFLSNLYFYLNLVDLLCFIAFFLGQIISLFLVLKFIEKNKLIE